MIEGLSLPEPNFSDDGVALVEGIELKRTIRQIGAGGCVTIRLRLRNLRQQAIRLIRLPVFASDDPQWVMPRDRSKVFRFSRQKNDVPGMFRPAVVDFNQQDARRDTADVQAGGGLHAGVAPLEDLHAENTYHSDPGLVLTDDQTPGSRCTFFGFTGQTRHLNDVQLIAPLAEKGPTTLIAYAIYEGVLLQPGEEREAHDFVIETGSDERALFESHVDRVAAEHPARPQPTVPLSVYCTWYFYGSSFHADDLDDNLTALQKYRIPFDVFQIDDGWSDNFGDWNTNLKKFPQGMAQVAKRIREFGMIPGIWTCPFAFEQKAEVLQRWPDLILRNREGKPCIFPCGIGDLYTLDPFAPHARQYIHELYHKLTDWGFGYHKLDFLRAMFVHPTAQFADPGCNCAQAYRLGMTMLREAVGEKGLVAACGGLFEGTAGLVDSNRSGSDVQGQWNEGESYVSHYVLRMKQNVVRNVYRKLWMTDADALQVRRRAIAWLPLVENNKRLSRGLLNDEQAFSTVVNQFLCGGVAVASDRLCEIERDRMLLYRHVMPQYAGPGRYFYDWTGYLPEYYVTHFEKPGNGLEPFSVVVLANWNGKKEEVRRFRLQDVPGLDKQKRYAAFEFREQRYLGLYSSEQWVELSIPQHSCRVVRLCAYTGDKPMLLGTDMSLSSGMELGQWKVDGNQVSGLVKTRWPETVTLSVLLPGARGDELRHVSCPMSARSFAFNWS